MNRKIVNKDIKYMNFTQYKRTAIAEMRPVSDNDIQNFKDNGEIVVLHDQKGNHVRVSISDEDLKNGSPKIGDMIARNPKNNTDQWLVAEAYFGDNFEPI